MHHIISSTLTLNQNRLGYLKYNHHSVKQARGNNKIFYSFSHKSRGYKKKLVQNQKIIINFNLERVQSQNAQFSKGNAFQLSGGTTN